MNDNFDQILDVCLAEVLGGQTPPDLSQRILHAFLPTAPVDARREAAAEDLILPPSCIDPFPVAAIRPCVAGSVAEQVKRTRSRGGGGMAAWAWGALALSSVVLVATIGALLVQDRGPESARTSQRGNRALPIVVLNPEPKSAPALPGPQSPVARPPRQVAAQLPPESTATVPNENIDPSTEISPPASKSPPTGTLVGNEKLPPPRSRAEILLLVDSKFDEFWKQNGFPGPNSVTGTTAAPASVSPDAWRQRAFEVLLGRKPNSEERQKFRVDSADGREALVASLLDSETYNDEFARHWSLLLADEFLPDDLLAANSQADREGMRRGMQEYFARALRDRHPFDRIATELLTATGSGLPGEDEYHGAANFLLARADGKQELATADTARLLLGRNIACLQCHDDPLDPQRRQQEFWELNAFFRQLVVLPGHGSQPAKLVDQDFKTEYAHQPRELVIFYDTPDMSKKAVVPTFSGRTDLPKSGLIADVKWREVLARCVTDSPDFRRATVNRLWTLALGTGITPNEDISSADSETRNMLNTMGDQFAVHQFDPRQVLAWVVLSEPFATPAVDAPYAIGPEQRPVQRFVERSTARRRPVLESLVASAKRVDPSLGGTASRARPEEPPAGIGRNGKPVVEPPAVARPLFSNAPASTNPIVNKIIAHPTFTPQQKAEHLIQLKRHRPARPGEIKIVTDLIKAAGDQSAKAWQQVWADL